MSILKLYLIGIFLTIALSPLWISCLLLYALQYLGALAATYQVRFENFVIDVADDAATYLHKILKVE